MSEVITDINLIDPAKLESIRKDSFLPAPELAAPADLSARSFVVKAWTHYRSESTLLVTKEKDLFRVATYQTNERGDYWEIPYLTKYSKDFASAEEATAYAHELLSNKLFLTNFLVVDVNKNPVECKITLQRGRAYPQMVGFHIALADILIPTPKIAKGAKND